MSSCLARTYLLVRGSMRKPTSLEGQASAELKQCAAVHLWARVGGSPAVLLLARASSAARKSAVVPTSTPCTGAPADGLRLRVATELCVRTHHRPPAFCSDLMRKGFAGCIPLASQAFIAHEPFQYITYRGSTDLIVCTA